MGITINNKDGVVNIYLSAEGISKAKDTLLTKIYHARNKQTMGGYKAWKELIDMYVSADWQGMYDYISSCTGYGGKTRNECLQQLKIIMSGGN